ncbi:hypothetical protein ACFXGA_06240 [Actinosynnema sp. NPDC059335]|uniref:hypothetical protein n=1 Tax=Actinosynnema sp. NPDC059335 TaxID=3346804 RepID=UPI00366BEDF1
MREPVALWLRGLDERARLENWNSLLGRSVVAAWNAARAILAVPSGGGTRGALDAAIRAHAADLVDRGEHITGWLALAATRRFDGGGVVINLVSDDAMPVYEARGILAEAMAAVDRTADGEDQGGGAGGEG